MTVLYRKYRPQKLSEIIGQDHIKTALLKQLESGKIHHAYLFTGPKGTGKTSAARIIAKALNCKVYGLQSTDHSQVRLGSSKKSGRSPKAVVDKPTFGEPCNRCNSCQAITTGTHLDLIEIDAASNRGIDDVRDLREKIKLAPSAGQYKVYIIDEAHMLTPEAFNALLKTLEEPPPHAIFILATTEPHKLPGTILSRSQRFDFGRPNIKEIQDKLKKIIKQEKWKVEEGGLEEIAKAAGGAFRDAEVILEKVGAVNPKASREEILQIVGKKNISQVLEILQIVEEKDSRGALLWLDEFTAGGGNIRVLNEAIIDALRKILLIQAGAGEKLVKDVSREEYENLKNLAESIGSPRLNQLINLFARSIEELAMATIPQLPLELALLEACDYRVETESESVNEKPVTTEDTEKKDARKFRDSENPRGSVVARGAFGSKGRSSPQNAESDPKLLNKIKRAWPNILKEAKSKNKSLDLFLRDAVLDSLEDGILRLKFTYRFHKDRVEDPKNREIIEELLARKVAQPVRIKGATTESRKGSETRKDEEAQGETRKKDEVDPAAIFGNID